MNSPARKLRDPKPKLDPLIVKQLRKAGLLVLLLSVLIILGGIYFEPQLLIFAQFVADRFGFIGMCIALLVTDSLVTPFPPDLLLLIIAKSEMHEHWFFYVTILGFISTGAGIVGWCIGRWLGHLDWVHKLFGGLQDSHRDFVRKNGALAVVMGALTPIPFSVTCWTAGVLELPLSTTSLAALLRVPRFVFYYLLIYYSVSISDLIKINGF